MGRLTRPVNAFETDENALHGSIVGEEMAVVELEAVT
jgi:hypothetical protein